MPILYPIPRTMSMATRKSKPTGERFYTRFTFLETRLPAAYLPTRRDAASPWFIHLASHPKETHRPGASRRRGETPHLLELSLIAICDRASTANIIMKLRRFAKRLRYRCGRCFARLNRPHPTRRGGLSHGDAASSRVKFAALPKGVRRSATDKVK